MRIVGGSLKGRTIRMPAGDRTRPTTDASREALFSILQHHVDVEGTSIIDICCGSGSLGFEALSRGARHCIFVDSSRTVCQTVKETAVELELAHRITIYCAGAEHALAALSRQPPAQAPFHLVFTDPPYAAHLCNRIVHLVEISGLIVAGSIVVAEHSPREALLPGEAWQQLSVRERGDTTLEVRKFVG